MGHPATGSAVSILSHGWTRINTDQREISNGRLCGFIRCATNGQRRPSNHRAARRASALEFTIHRAVFGCRSTSSSTPPGARHAEGVNSSAEPRNAHRLSSPHLAAPSPRDRPQGSNRRPVSCRRIVTTKLTGWPPISLPSKSDRIGHSGPATGYLVYACAGLIAVACRSSVRCRRRSRTTNESPNISSRFIGFTRRATPMRLQNRLVRKRR
jgi:hypothetical protein